jgi:NADPH-dependent glutamate synthase beta subunit-like oxidoreductase
MVAQGRYDDAYILNRESNVFPGILGRTCDRPCEPACRRGRIEEKPVAICRIKRVAADLKGDVRDRLPKIAPKNGKRVACIGAGPASLTVANDLLPLGYEVVIFEKNARPGGLMRTNVPSFRLPAHVLDEEIAMIVDLGAEVRYETPVQSLKALLGSGFDAVFVGSGAPRGKDLDLPGRKEAAEHIHIGIDWLESVAFDHIDKIGERVLIIGVGNTAMDCCRTARRLGGKDVKVMARRDRQHFKASPWELEDAEEEQVDILVNHVPTRHRAGERLPLHRARHRHRVRQVGHAQGRREDHGRNQARRLLRRRRGLGPQEHHLGGRARARGGDLDPQPLPGRGPHRAAAGPHEPHHPEDGAHRVVLQQRLQPGASAEDEARRPARALQAAVD